MEEIIQIKKGGKSLILSATQEAENIILTKKGDKSDSLQKRKIIIEPMSLEKYREFIDVKIEESFQQRLYNIIKANL